MLQLVIHIKTLHRKLCASVAAAAEVPIWDGPVTSPIPVAATEVLVRDSPVTSPTPVAAAKALVRDGPVMSPASVAATQSRPRWPCDAKRITSVIFTDNCRIIAHIPWTITYSSNTSLCHLVFNVFQKQSPNVLFILYLVKTDIQWYWTSNPLHLTGCHLNCQLVHCLSPSTNLLLCNSHVLTTHSSDAHRCIIMACISLSDVMMITGRLSNVWYFFFTFWACLHFYIFPLPQNWHDVID